MVLSLRATMCYLLIDVPRSLQYILFKMNHLFYIRSSRELIFPLILSFTLQCPQLVLQHQKEFAFLPFPLHLFIYLLVFGCSVSLQEEQNCSAATISNHISSLLYPIKFVYRKHPPDFKEVPIVCKVRVQASILQKEGDLKRPSTIEDLAAQNRWIPWLVLT